MTPAWWEHLTARRSSPATCATSASPTPSSSITSGSRNSIPDEKWNELPRLGKAFYQRFFRRQFEMNDHRAIIVGVCVATPTFQSNPVVYTTYGRAKTFAPQERKILSYILAKAVPGVSPETVAIADQDPDRPGSHRAATVSCEDDDLSIT